MTEAQAIDFSCKVNFWKRGGAGFDSAVFKMIELADEDQLKTVASAFPIHVEAFKRFAKDKINTRSGRGLLINKGWKVVMLERWISPYTGQQFNSGDAILIELELAKKTEPRR